MVTPNTTTYCQVQDIADFLSTKLDSTTTPNSLVVSKIINRKEDYFDRKTGHAWRSVAVVKEHHRLTREYTMGYGQAIDLRHRTVTLSSGAGDKIEYWDGLNFIDVLATGATPGDYLINPEDGVIYVTGFLYTAIKWDRFRISYHYGETTVPKDIEEAIVKLVCIDLISSNLYNDLLPAGTTDEQKTAIISQWKNDVDDIIDLHREFEAMTQ